MLRENGVDLNTGVQHVSYFRHKLASIAPGIFGEPDFMHSEKPKWLKRITESTADTTGTLIKSNKESKTPSPDLLEEPEEGKESLWEKWKDKLGL